MSDNDDQLRKLSEQQAQQAKAISDLTSMMQLMMANLQPAQVPTATPAAVPDERLTCDELDRKIKAGEIVMGMRFLLAYDEHISYVFGRVEASNRLLFGVNQKLFIFFDRNSNICDVRTRQTQRPASPSASPARPAGSGPKKPEDRGEGSNGPKPRFSNRPGTPKRR